MYIYDIIHIYAYFYIFLFFFPAKIWETIFDLATMQQITSILTAP